MIELLTAIKAASEASQSHVEFLKLGLYAAQRDTFVLVSLAWAAVGWIVLGEVMGGYRIRFMWSGGRSRP